MNKPTRYYSTIQEKSLADKVGGKTVPNSGATPFYKGDVKSERWLYECKTTTSKKSSYTVNKDVLDKLKSEAFGSGKDMYSLVFRFEPSGKDYFVLDERTFLQLLDAYYTVISEN